METGIVEWYGGGGKKVWSLFVQGWQRVFASQKGKEVKKVLVDNYPMSILRNAKTKTSGKYAFLKMFCIMFYEFSRAHGWGEGGGKKVFDIDFSHLSTPSPLLVLDDNCSLNTHTFLKLF